MDLAKSFHRVIEIAEGATTVDDAWASLVKYLHASLQAPRKTSFASVPIDQDVATVRASLKRLLRDEPPLKTIDAFYFGLFDAVDDSGTETIGYYVAGIAGFDPDDADTLCDPAWWPDGRY